MWLMHFQAPGHTSKPRCKNRFSFATFTLGTFFCWQKKCSDIFHNIHVLSIYLYMFVLAFIRSASLGLDKKFNKIEQNFLISSFTCYRNLILECWMFHDWEWRNCGGSSNEGFQVSLVRCSDNMLVNPSIQTLTVWTCARHEYYLFDRLGKFGSLKRW